VVAVSLENAVKFFALSAVSAPSAFTTIHDSRFTIDDSRKKKPALGGPACNARILFNKVD
jgi:hypothetical protein